MSNTARITSRIPLVARIAAVATLAIIPRAAHANGAVLPPANAAEPSALDIELAVAVTPFGTTRWTRLTVGGTTTVLWLVPARPGAALDWASDGWLATLEEATSPRVAPPSASPPCGLPAAPERVPSWSTVGVKKFPRAVAVQASANDARAYATTHGYAVSADVSTRIGDAYAKGYVLVSLELETSGGSLVSSPTLRISDDGGSIVPLALTGSAVTAVRVTAMVLGDGPTMLPGARDFDPNLLAWGKTSSGYGCMSPTAE